MFVLDTDHVGEYQKGRSPNALRLKQRIDETTEPVTTTIVTVEEVMRGWMAAIRRSRDPRHLISSYGRLQQLFHFFALWTVLPWDENSASVFEAIRQQKIRVGTMDLRIASIALVHDATLLTRNQSDFGKIPNLRTEDWLGSQIEGV